MRSANAERDSRTSLRRADDADPPTHAFHPFPHPFDANQAIPSLLFFKNGQLRDQVTGMMSKKDLLGRLAALV